MIITYDVGDVFSLLTPSQQLRYTQFGYITPASSLDSKELFRDSYVAHKKNYSDSESYVITCSEIAKIRENSRLPHEYYELKAELFPTVVKDPFADDDWSKPLYQPGTVGNVSLNKDMVDVKDMSVSELKRFIEDNNMSKDPKKLFYVRQAECLLEKRSHELVRLVQSKNKIFAWLTDNQPISSKVADEFVSVIRDCVNFWSKQEQLAKSACVRRSKLDRMSLLEAIYL